MKTKGAIILAAGKGERYGGYKQFEVVAGRTLVGHTHDLYQPLVDKIVICLPIDHIMTPKYNIVIGGKTRFDSIKAGFEVVADCDQIMIVDAVRCNTSIRIITDLFRALDNFEVACPILPCVQTSCMFIKGELKGIMNKNIMYDIQTPTAVRKYVLEDILNMGLDSEGFSIAYMASQYGYSDIALIPGDADNFKITYKKDLDYFRMLKTYGVYEAPAVDLGEKDAS